MNEVKEVPKPAKGMVDSEMVEQIYDFDLLNRKGEPYYALRRKGDSSGTPIALLVCPIQAQRICRLLSLYEHLKKDDPDAVDLIDDGKMIKLESEEDEPLTIASLFGLYP